MYAKVEKPKENKSREVANSVVQKKGSVKQGFGFVDNRSEVITQTKMINSINMPLQRAVNINGQLMSSMQQVAKNDEAWEFYTNLDSETKTLFRDFVSDDYHTVQDTTFLKWMESKSKKTASKVGEVVAASGARSSSSETVPMLSTNMEDANHRASQSDEVSGSTTAAVATSVNVSPQSGLLDNREVVTKIQIGMIEGYSGRDEETKSKMEKYPEFYALFNAQVQDKEIRNPYTKKTTKRSKFRCAEPNALSKLLEIVGQYNLKGRKFNGNAQNTKTSQTMEPCPVCQQWVNPDLSINDNIIPIQSQSLPKGDDFPTLSSMTPKKGSGK